jgi:hypothetical protein
MLFALERELVERNMMQRFRPFGVAKTSATVQSGRNGVNALRAICPASAARTIRERLHSVDRADRSGIWRLYRPLLKVLKRPLIVFRTLPVVADRISIACAVYGTTMPVSRRMSVSLGSSSNRGARGP